MTRSMILGLVFTAWGMAVAAAPAVAQTSVIPGVKLPGVGEDITDLLQDRNGVTVATDGELTGVHPNELLISYGARDITAANGGQTIVVGSEETDFGEAVYRTAYVPTAFILGAPSPVTPNSDPNCLIFDFTDGTANPRPTDSETYYRPELKPVMITSYQVSGAGSPTGIKIDIEDGRITATDQETGYTHLTLVHNSDGTLVDAETIKALLVVHDGTPVPVGPGGDQVLHVVDPDNPDTFVASKVSKNIIVVGSKIKEVVKEAGLRGGDLDDVFVVDARRLGLSNDDDPLIPLDGGGGNDVYVVRSAADNTRDLKITVRDDDDDIVILADFGPEFETLSLGDGVFEFIQHKVDGFVVKQVIHFVDETGAPVSSTQVPTLVIRGAEIPS